MVAQHIIQKLNNILWCYFFLFGVAAQGQSEYSVTNYPEFKGIHIKAIQSDQEGRLWISTQSGLVLFDGYDLKRFHPNLLDSTTIGSLNTYGMYTDKQKNLWIGINRDVSKYNPRTRSFKNYVNAYSSNYPENAIVGVGTINVLNSGEIFLGISGTYSNRPTQSLYYLDQSLDSLLQFNLPEKYNIKHVFQIVKGPNDQLLFITNEGVFKIDVDKNLEYASEFNNLLNNDFFNGIHVDKNQNIWLTTSNKRLIKFDVDQNSSNSYDITGIEDYYQFQRIPLISDQNGRLWIGTSNGLLFFDQNALDFTRVRYGVNDDLDINNISYFHLDSFNHLWVGTTEDGLFKLSNKKLFQSFIHDPDDPASFTSQWAGHILELSDGRIVVHSHGGPFNRGINIIDLKKNSIKPISYRSIADENRTIFRTIGKIGTDSLLMAGFEGLVGYDVLNGKVFDVEMNGIPATTEVNDLLVTNGNRLFATSNGIFLQKKNESVIREIYKPDNNEVNIIEENIIKLYSSLRGGVWMLTNSGLHYLDTNMQNVTSIGMDENEGDVLPIHDINSIYEENEEVIWIGTWEGGLYRYDLSSNKIEIYGIKDGLASSSIQGILHDEEEDVLWLSTFNGISRFDKKTKEIENYYLKDGIQGLYYADNSYLKTSDDYFVFGGNNGITYFRPSELAVVSPPPNIYIEEIFVGDEKIDFSYFKSSDSQNKELLLEHHQNNIAINYVAIQYDNPLENTYSYMLEGYDPDWLAAGKNKSAFYNNLPPGEYIFKVKAANSNGIWTEKGKSVQFTILPPWWNTWWAYAMYGLGILFVGLQLYRFQQRRIIEKERSKAREKELAQAKEIEKAYHDLKVTQTQLIHAEKMASLGELTAGIAHEIQNPLNFVNNFSEVSAELLEELKEEVKKGDFEEVNSISKDLQSNLKKINEHGKRADSIVKGMLMHSRSSTGDKEMTDINALCEEYLRLSYHGMRAKNRNFNVDYDLKLEPALPKIKVIPQDVGRVLLNIINNAFQALTDLSDRQSESLQGLKALKGVNNPKVVVSTKNLSDSILITISDNGPGIPDDVKDKIFQPFFTTKATGEGTGLGLSLAYDIVKAHKGDIQLETKESKGTTFKIYLPSE